MGAGAEQYRDRPALRIDGLTVSYAELRDRAHAFAGALERLGLGPGDRLLIMEHNTVEFVDAIPRSEATKVSRAALVETRGG